MYSRKVRAKSTDRAAPAASSGSPLPPGEPMLSHADKIRAVLVEIKRIRTLVKEIASNFVSKVEGRVVELVQLIETQGPSAPEKLPAMLRRIREISVKPDKGRRKDLKQLELLVDELWSLAEELEEKREKEKEKEKEKPSAPKSGRSKKVLAAAR